MNQITAPGRVQASARLMEHCVEVQYSWSARWFRVETYEMPGTAKLRAEMRKHDDEVVQTRVVHRLITEYLGEHFQSFPRFAMSAHADQKRSIS